MHKFRYNLINCLILMETLFLKKRNFLLILISTFIIASCSGLYRSEEVFEASPSVDEGESRSTPTPTPSATWTPGMTPLPTSTPTKTPIPPTVTPTPEELIPFTSEYLLKNIEPVAYLDDPCVYLSNRWDENKSQPGTVVVPIMFHSVVQPGREIKDSISISMEYFEYFMARAEQLGFSTITTEQLISFLENNDKIPERSMILILDDRRPGVTRTFMPYLESNDWTLTLAWLTRDESYDEVWWREIGQLAESGHLDIQSHGHNSVYIQDITPEEVVRAELFQPMRLIEERIGTAPQAHIWSGGNFTQTAIDLAHEAGYQIGFTAYSRGPVMFNWIPLGEPERSVDDPLMVLPRYWSTAADVALEDAIRIGEEIRKNAEDVKLSEMAYLSLYCQDSAGD